MMNKLQQYFPMIRTKEEVLKEIENNSKLPVRYVDRLPEGSEVGWKAAHCEWR